MKRKDFFYFTGILLLTASMLIFGGCSDEPEENKVDDALVGNWSNEKTGDDLKTFTIKLDGSFSATLSPYKDQPGTVTGILIKDGIYYVMNKMEANAEAIWRTTVLLYNNSAVQIKFSDDNTFFLESKDRGNAGIDTFFGDTYYRQQ